MSGSAAPFFDDDLLRRLELYRLAWPGRAGPAPRSQGAARRPIGDGLDFADHRPYTPGDDLRFVDWRLAARQDRLLVRRFHTHSSADLAVLLDTSASMDAAGPGGFDRVRKLAAALAAVAVGEGRAVRVMTLGAGLSSPWQVGPCRDELHRLWAHLAGLSPAGRWDVPRCLDELPSRLSGAGSCVLISDGLDIPADLGELLAALDPTRRDVTWLCPQPNLSAQPVPDGAVRLVHAESGERRDVTVTPTLRAVAQRAQREGLAELGRVVHAAGGVLIPLDAEATIRDLLFEVLPGLGFFQPAP
jgi:uncharacterized protein (DUF58 family)